ncbi:hypothetical protein Goari_013524, partial [Gossypium aridum]|nr:hypothetical protein [Gossypium aridum]
MTIWRISWDYIPNFVNLRCRKVIVNEECPRCQSWPEESIHVFRDCPITKEIWTSLDLFWVMDNTSQSYWEWLTWVFQKGNDAQCRLFCYALWMIWVSRNQFIYERKNSTGRAIAQSIQRQMAEIEGVRDLKTQKTMVRKFGVQEDLPKAAIQFDAAFDKRSFKSASGLVGWDQNGDLLVLKTVIHKKVSSAFAAEAYACLESMKLGIALRMPSIKIMGDSKTVINKCQKNSIDKSVIGAIISDIHSKKSCFQDLIFQHIYRSENSNAHKLARRAIDR